MNPMVVSRAQQTCTVAEEQAVGVVRNHAGGTRSVPGSNDPKARRWQHRRTGSGLHDRVRRRGGLWKTPREEFRCLRHRNARTGMRRERGAEGHEGGFDRMLTCSVGPERRSSKVPVVPRERCATQRPRAAAASQCAATSLRCFPRGHDQRIQGERSRTVRTWQQCRSRWPGEGITSQDLLLDFMLRGVWRQGRSAAQATGSVRRPVGPKNPIPGRHRADSSSPCAQA